MVLQSPSGSLVDCRAPPLRRRRGPPAVDRLPQLCCGQGRHRRFIIPTPQENIEPLHICDEDRLGHVWTNVEALPFELAISETASIRVSCAVNVPEQLHAHQDGAHADFPFEQIGSVALEVICFGQDGYERVRHDTAVHVGFIQLFSGAEQEQE